ncbi:hypothetical protein DZC72_12005 [Maribacter algicola]|uniref:Thiol-activated cytolysin n=1 Tax=Maribacter algicola TaxID=2498892 RepID=A0A3R8Q2G2_9FLAO|nr:thiol-activated cytolysin family protein [Maribacter algicola]RRQ48425.1 hypothetical protein DZC72_12005 [Maribacter algicola]
MKKHNNSGVARFTRISISIILIIGLGCSQSDDAGVEIPNETQEEEPTQEPDTEKEVSFADILKVGALTNVSNNNASDTLSVMTVESKLVRQLFNNNMEDVRYGCSNYTIESSKSETLFPIYGEIATALYSGSFIQGNSLETGIPTSIPLTRSGGTLSISNSAQTLLGTVSIDEFNPTQVALARTELLAQNNPSPGQYTNKLKQISSLEQIAFEVGLTEEIYNTQLNNGLGIPETFENSTFLISIQQDFYTINYDLPLNKEGYFEASVKPSDLNQYVSESNPAAYVAKVNYGRRFTIVIETSTFANTAQETIAQAFSSFNGTTQGTLNTTALNDLEDLSLKVILQSANSQGPVERVGTITLSELEAHLSEPALLSFAQPLGYEVRSINEPDRRAGISLNLTYEQNSCTIDGALPPENFRPLVNLFEDGVGAACFFRNGLIIVFNGAGTEYVWLNAITGQISQKSGIKDTDGLLPALNADAVSAAFAESASGTLYFFNSSGTSYEIHVNNNTFGSNAPDAFPTEAPVRPFTSSVTGEPIITEINPFWQVASAPGETAPFLESGVEAAAYTGRANQTDPTDEFSYSDYQDFFEKGRSNRWAGRDVRVVNRSADYFWTDIFDLRDISRNEFPFEEVGAACALEVERGILQQIYFNLEGDKFFIANMDKQLVAGPYLLY